MAQVVEVYARCVLNDFISVVECIMNLGYNETIKISSLYVWYLEFFFNYVNVYAGNMFFTFMTSICFFFNFFFLCFSYTLFPLLLLLDAAVDCRTSEKVDSEGSAEMFDVLKKPHKVSDRVAEGVLQCLEELLVKCHLGSVEQVI